MSFSGIYVPYSPFWREEIEHVVSIVSARNHLSLRPASFAPVVELEGGDNAATREVGHSVLHDGNVYPSSLSVEYATRYYSVIVGHL